MRLLGGPGRTERHARLAALASAFARRGRPGGEDACAEALARLEEALPAGIHRAPARPPPPRVARAFVAAVLSEGHLRAALGVEGPTRPPPRPDVLERLFPGSSCEEVLQRLDRRAARHLRQARALDWMWTRFGLDRRGSAGDLGRLLLPGRGTRVGLVRRGAQLYCVVEGVPAGAASIFLPWRSDPALPPAASGMFRARAVDPGLRAALGRAVGADAAELDLLLESMVCAVADGAAVEADGWRASGRAALTALGLPYTAGRWLARAPREEEITWRRWLEARGGGLRARVEPHLVFDGLAARRAEVMLRCLYAGLLSEPAGGPAPWALDLLDVGGHLAAVLRPLIEWPRDPAVHRRVAEALGLPITGVAEALARLADGWARHAERIWLAPPDAERPYTVHGVLTEHLVALAATLRRHGGRRDPGEVVRLFAGHHLARAPVERLWLGGLSDMPHDEGVPPPEDLPGAWFPTCWRRLREVIGPQAAPNAPRATA